MATTTPINGWPVPTSTDLVTNGASAIESLGDAIDTSVGSGLQSWTSWSPVLSAGWLNGNGVWTARYAKLGQIVIATGYFVVGSTTTKGTGMTVTLPVTASEKNNINGVAWAGTSASSGFSMMHVFPATTSTVTFFANNSAGSYLASGSVSAAVPITWATNSVVSFTVIYEAA
jgi:hypothetical protein